MHTKAMAESIVFIGGGNMGTSLIGGLVASDYPVDCLRIVDPSCQRLDQLRKQFGIAGKQQANADFLNVDIWVLAVKPQVMAQVVTPLASLMADTPPLVISIAAGIPVRALSRWLGADTPIVRCMPNTPALVNTGSTALFAGDNVSDEQRKSAKRILRSAGITAWVEQESALDAVTATSGSGPAYFFAFMEAMQSSAQQLGLPEATARRLVLQTALGAARMALESGDDPAELRRKVTSPGGTTERALTILEEGGFDQLIDKAMRAAAGRSAELSEQLDQ